LATLRSELNNPGFQLADTPVAANLCGRYPERRQVGQLSAREAGGIQERRSANPDTAQFVSQDKLDVQFIADAGGDAVPNNYLWISQGTVLGAGTDATAAAGHARDQSRSLCRLPQFALAGGL